MSDNESRDIDKIHIDDENDINQNSHERIFADRNQWIVRMCQNKPKSYQEMMERNENLLREMSRTYFKKERNEEEEQHHRRQEERISKMPWMSLGQILRFEIRFAFQGYFMLVLYCITHLMTYQLVESCIMEQTRGFTGNQENQFYFLLLVVSLFILRITGGLWDWLSPNRCTAVQSEIKRQHQVANRNSWDMNVQSWLQKRRHVRIFVQYVAFYVILVAIVYFKHQFFTLLIHDRSWIYENLPSRQYNMETPISQALVANVANREKCEQIDEQCSLLTHMTQQDDEYLYSRITLTSYFNFRGYSGMYLVSPFGMRLLLSTISVIGIFILEKLGFQWKR
jgi:hypothetical protein